MTTTFTQPKPEPTCRVCGLTVPREQKRGPQRQLHPECAEKLRQQRDRERAAERKSMRTK